MKLSTLQKIGGIALIIGSLLLTIYSICFSTLLPVAEIRRTFTLAVLNANWIWTAVTAYVGVLFMIFGFAAVYSRLYKEAGITGLLGYIFVEIAYIIQACKVTWEIFIYPIIASNQNFKTLLDDRIIINNTLVAMFQTAASATIFIGIILFCIALIRSKEFPKIGGILVFAGAVIYGFGPMLSVAVAISGITILSVGCLILGLELVRGQRQIEVAVQK